MSRDEIKLQVALSCIQGVLEAKHGIIGEIIPSFAVKESLRIADEFVKEWFKTNEEDNEISNDLLNFIDTYHQYPTTYITNETKDKWKNWLKGKQTKENNEKQYVYLIKINRIIRKTDVNIENPFPTESYLNLVFNDKDKAYAECEKFNTYHSSWANFEVEKHEVK